MTDHIDALAEGVVLPAQWIALMRSSASTPEKALIVAIFVTAIGAWQMPRLTVDMMSDDTVDARSRRRRALAIRRETIDWFYDDDSHGPFSFLWCCDALGWDPEWVRKGLLEWRQRGEMDKYKQRVVALRGGH